MGLPRSKGARIAALLAAAVALLLIATQIFLPGIGEGAIEARLTERGGVAEVSLAATPAARLLWGDGDRIGVSAAGLDLPLRDADPDVFRSLDRFGAVEIGLAASTVGPVRIERFTLSRDGDAPYELRSVGTTSAADLAEFLAEGAELPGAGVIGGVIGITGIGGAPVDFDLDMALASEDGRVEVLDGGGEVAGIPTGPLAELITRAILERLDP